MGAGLWILGRMTHAQEAICEKLWCLIVLEPCRRCLTWSSRVVGNPSQVHSINQNGREGD